MGLRAELFRAKTRPALISTWHEHCSHALSLHDDVTRVLPNHRPPGGLRSWLDITDDPMSGHRTIPGQSTEYEPSMTPARGDGR